MLEDLEDVDCAIEVNYLAAHSDQHSTHENPHFLLHFLRLYERHVEVHLLELQRIFRVLLRISVSSLIGRGLIRLWFESLSVIFRQSAAAAFAIVLVPSKRSYFSLQLLNTFLKIRYSPFFLDEILLLFCFPLALPFLYVLALLLAIPSLFAHQILLPINFMKALCLFEGL